MVSIAGLPAQFLAKSPTSGDLDPPKKKQRIQQIGDIKTEDASVQEAPWNKKLEQALADPA